jgi:hypothetical protein
MFEGIALVLASTMYSRRQSGRKLRGAAGLLGLFTCSEAVYLFFLRRAPLLPNSPADHPLIDFIPDDRALAEVILALSYGYALRPLGRLGQPEVLPYVLTFIPPIAVLAGFMLTDLAPRHFQLFHRLLHERDGLSEGAGVKR